MPRSQLYPKTALEPKILYFITVQWLIYIFPIPLLLNPSYVRESKILKAAMPPELPVPCRAAQSSHPASVDARCVNRSATPPARQACIPNKSTLDDPATGFCSHLHPPTTRNQSSRDEVVFWEYVPVGVVAYAPDPSYHQT